MIIKKYERGKIDYYWDFALTICLDAKNILNL